ncbi:MAG: Apo-citrate lyase phosphoribosyl-dephospho-CoA transferase [Desulfovibrio sp.]
MDVLAPITEAASLEAILDNREKRAERQRAFLEKYRMPLVSFTVNMPGAVKDNAAARIVFAEGVRLLDVLVREKGWFSPDWLVTEGVTGPELLACVESDARVLKKCAVTLEESASLGRLFDMDVLDAAGISVSRADIGVSSRRCLVCSSPAKECGRSQKHGYETVLEKVREMIVLYSE